MNTGKKIYPFLRQKSSITDEYTGIYKPNIPSDPDYVPPTFDYDTCPVTYWQPIDPYCELQPICPSGFQYNADLNACIRIETSTPILRTDISRSLIPVIPFNSTLYGRGSAYVMNSGYTTDGQGSVRGVLNNSIWINGNTPFDAFNTSFDGFVNSNGIKGSNLTHTPIFLSKELIVSTSQYYYIAICTNMVIEIQVNNVTILSISPDLIVDNIAETTIKDHVVLFPVLLNSGLNSLLVSINPPPLETPNPDFYFAALRIYSNSFSQLSQATSVNSLNSIYSFVERFNTFFDDLNPLLWQCPSGWTLDISNLLYPICRKQSTETVQFIKTGFRAFDKRQLFKNGSPALNEDDEEIIEDNVIGDNYISPIFDPLSCNND